MDTRNSQMYQRLLKLVSIPSVSPSSSEENRAAQAIYTDLAELDYFKENPEDLRLLPVEGDPLERHIVFAVVRAAEEMSRTVLLTGHMDVVGTDVCGGLKEWAFDPEEYTRRLQPETLKDDARQDLLSGEWLFGRGVADMKAGVSAGMTLLAEASQYPEGLRANLAVLFVPDEENNSEGMLGAVTWLVRLQGEGFDFVGCINTEPTFATGEKAHPTAYLGSIGKINPFFYCLGVETHVGEYYEGFSAGLLATQINFSLDGNVELADSFENTAYPPFACLKINDMRAEYSATVLSHCALFYSYLTATKLPGRLLEELKGMAIKATERAIERNERSRRAFCFRNRLPFAETSMCGTVLTVDEVMKLAEDKLGTRRQHLCESILSECPSKGDVRDRALDLISRVVDRLELEGPLVVVGYLPPWYPHRANVETAPGDRVLAAAAADLAQEAKRSGLGFEIRPFFEGVSDLSYCGFMGDIADVKAFEDNMPGGRGLYRFPSEELVRLHIPVMNFGPVGKDAHKKTERLHLPFYLESYPLLLRYLVDRIATTTVKHCSLEGNIPSVSSKDL